MSQLGLFFLSNFIRLCCLASHTPTDIILFSLAETICRPPALLLLSLAVLLALSPCVRTEVATVGDVHYNDVVYVDCEAGNDTQGCGTRQEPCKSLAQAASIVKNDTLVSIPESSECPVDRVINISGYTNVGVVGNVNLTLKCNASARNSGLYLAAIEDLQLVNITFDGCGALFDSATSSPKQATFKIRVAVYVINVTNFMVNLTKFHSSTGIGLAVYDTNGEISVTDCDFVNNHVPQDERGIYPGGGGMLLYYTYCTPGLTDCDPSTNTHNSGSRISIAGCHFEGNQASNSDLHRTIVVGKGGGLGVMFAGNSTGNTLTLQSVVFRNNSGPYGGAVNVYLSDNASSNSFLMSGAVMDSNSASGDGGALRIGFEFFNCSLCIHNNTITISDTYFQSNVAQWGGAVECFSSHRTNNLYTDYIRFQNCTWDSNSAQVAAAVDVVPDAFSGLATGFLPIPVFENCTFVNNILLSDQSGILNIQCFEVHFLSYVIFVNNSGTALYSSDGIIVILNETQADFTNNTGINGGALSLMGSSVLRIHPGTHLYFTRNTALEQGGAIYYYSTFPSLFLYSYSCFLQYSESTVKPGNWSNVGFHFDGNTAIGYDNAQSIYATTLYPCAKAEGEGADMDEKLRSLFTKPPFYYSDPHKHNHIATYPHRLELSSNNLTAAPGQEFNMGLSVYDELNQTVKTECHCTITNGSTNASISSVYAYTSNGTMKLLGVPGHTVQLSLQTTGVRTIKTTVNILLAECPPGYVLPNRDDKSQSECVCSASAVGHRYNGIYRCDADLFQAILSENYWAGCLNKPEDRRVFVTAQCPPGFCTQETNGTLLLAHTCEGVEQQLCGSRNRRGTLCGECKENYTVYYHSSRYKCGECKHPELGLLFYALSELLPLTLLFVVIVVFGVSFTSGPANSFIFFAQVLDVSSLRNFKLSESGAYLTDIYQVIFGALNLDFLKLDVFSFCLWKNATVLKIFVFKYVTTAYAIAMLLVFILTVRFIPRCYSCLQRCVFRHSVRSSLVQGMSALLIISYAQCAKVSFQILSATILQGEDLQDKEKVVFLSGKTQFFSDDHLPYAIPALFVLLLTAVPPAILIAYPALTKHCGTFSCTMCYKAEEQEGVRFVSQWRSRMMPLFDSFQSCFKDNCRYFAGLYFIYRLAFSMAFAFADTKMEFYFSLEVIIIVILALHAIVQPYQNRFYNIVDAAIFADLAIINGLSLYNVHWTQFPSLSGDSLTVSSSIQTVLIYLPLLYIAFMIVLKISVRFARVRRFQGVRRLNEYLPIISEQVLEHEPLVEYNQVNNLPPRLLEESTRRRRQQATYGATARVTL